MLSTTRFLAASSNRVLAAAASRAAASTAAAPGPPTIDRARDDTPPPPAGRYLLTGACGQIGYELTRALASALGGGNVVATDARDAPRGELPAGVRYERLDVTDKDAVKRGTREREMWREMWAGAAVLGGGHPARLAR